MGPNETAKYVCVKCQEGCRSKSPRIHNRKYVRLSDDVKNIENTITLPAISL